MSTYASSGASGKQALRQEYKRLTEGEKEKRRREEDWAEGASGHNGDLMKSRPMQRGAPERS